nr:casein kinase II subunit alpha' [Hymenolepis microstoma]
MMSHGRRRSADVQDNFPDIILDKKNSFCKHQYKLRRMIGRGGSSFVYECESRSDNSKVAIKVLKEGANREQFEYEIRILLHLQGLPNIVHFMGMHSKTVAGGPALVLEYLDPRGFQKMSKSTDPQEIQFYMRELLIALDSCHSHDIIHRDIKPANILIDAECRKLRLTDFGLATYYRPRKNYSLSVCTLNFRPPEVLLGYKKYDFSFDLWSLGCVFAILIFKQNLFTADNEEELLQQIVNLLGRSSLMHFVKKYPPPLTNPIYDEMTASEGVPLLKYVTEENEGLATPQALDLLQNLLKFDHHERLTAKKALEHKYFLPTTL